MAPLLLSLLATGCGEPADERYAGLDVYDAPGGQYRVRYLSPPWRIEEAMGSTVTLEVESNAERFGVGMASAPPKYELVVSVIAGRSRGQMERAMSSAVDGGESIVVDAREVETNSGHTGWEFISVGEDFERNFRRVFLDRVDGGVVRLRFEANPALEERQVDEMIRAVEPDPPDPMPPGDGT